MFSYTYVTLILILINWISFGSSQYTNQVEIDQRFWQQLADDFNKGVENVFGFLYKGKPVEGITNYVPRKCMNPELNENMLNCCQFRPMFGNDVFKSCGVPQNATSKTLQENKEKGRQDCEYFACIFDKYGWLHMNGTVNYQAYKKSLDKMTEHQHNIKESMQKAQNMCMVWPVSRIPYLREPFRMGENLKGCQIKRLNACLRAVTLHCEYFACIFDKYGWLHMNGTVNYQAYKKSLDKMTEHQHNIKESMQKAQNMCMVWPVSRIPYLREPFRMGENLKGCQIKRLNACLRAVTLHYCRWRNNFYCMNTKLRGDVIMCRDYLFAP